MNKKITVCKENAEHINAMIHEVEGRARCRVVGDYDTLAELVETAEHYLRGLFGSAKSALYGIRCLYVANEKLPRSYGYNAYATYVEFQFDASGVPRVSGIGRTRTGWTDREWFYTFTDVHRERIINRAERGE